MIKSVIITHGNLGRELVQVTEKILEQKLDIETIAFDWQGDGSAMISQLESFIARHPGKKVVIFTDMFGGSPSNISTRFVGPSVEVISGINLPGLLKFFCCGEHNGSFRQVIKKVEQGAKEGINIISEYLGEKK
ncbi:MAG: PTS sugar transporter subunit IIA [Acidobacteria bacterium]|jgi:PTS system mannose-specific IIA component|nr:PTS sugar transporter subunit IIA [Acidobacteriota bacterium]